MSIEGAKGDVGQDFKFPAKEGVDAKTADAIAADAAKVAESNVADHLNKFMDSSNEGKLFTELMDAAGGVDGAEATLVKAGATVEQAKAAVGTSSLVDLPKDVYLNIQQELSGKSAKAEAPESPKGQGGIYGM